MGEDARLALLGAQDCGRPQKAKRALQEIRMAETKKDALAAFDAFRRGPGASNSTRRSSGLTKDREALLAFYDFPAESLEASAHDG